MHLSQQARQVHRVPPVRRFFHALGVHHGRNQGRQHLLGMLPTDVVQQLEGLVGEVQGMTHVQKQMVRSGGEEHLADGRLGHAGAPRGPQGSLGGV